MKQIVKKVKMPNPNLRKNKSYYMNFKHKNTNYIYAFITYIISVNFKVHVMM